MDLYDYESGRYEGREEGRSRRRRSRSRSRSRSGRGSTRSRDVTRRPGEPGRNDQLVQPDPYVRRYIGSSRTKPRFWVDW